MDFIVRKADKVGETMRPALSLTAAVKCFDPSKDWLACFSVFTIVDFLSITPSLSATGATFMRVR
jgi:hypothetical protein